MPKKCIAVHLPLDLLGKIDEQKAKTGLSQSGVITDLIEKGLGLSGNDKALGKTLFFVKVRIDTVKMAEFGQKLKSGELDTSRTIMTFCAKDDPTVGMSFWYADSLKDFEKVFAGHKRYYKEIIEIVEVITPMDSMKLIMKNNQVQAG